MEKKAVRKTDEKTEIKRLPYEELKVEYARLYDKYTKIAEGRYCHQCDEFKPVGEFYKSKKTASGVIPTCKKCLYNIATNYNPNTKTTNETKASIKKALRMADLPFIKSVYEDAANRISDNGDNVGKTTMWTTIMSAMAISRYSEMTYEDSDDEAVVDSMNDSVTQETRDRFPAYTDPKDLLYLQREYDEWTTIHGCETKAQEILYQTICCNQLERNNIVKAGGNTKDIDKTLQELLSSANVKPTKTSSAMITEGNTFGMLLEQWETKAPVSDDPDVVEDPDHLGLYIDVFFKGHLAKMAKIENDTADLYEKTMRKFACDRNVYEEDSNNDAIFARLFGSAENIDSIGGN